MSLSLSVFDFKIKESASSVFTIVRQSQIKVQSVMILFLIRYGAANMAAVKPMIQQQQQPSGARPNTSYNNNNNGRPAALSKQQEQSIIQVKGQQRKILHSAALKMKMPEEVTNFSITFKK